VGYVHAIAHQLGALYHLPHGLANAIVLPYVLDYSLPHCQPRLARLARAAGLPCEGQSDELLAAAFVARVRQLNSVLSIPRSVAPLRKEDFERITDNAFSEAHGTYGVPRYLDRRDAHALLSRLLPAQNAPAGAKEP
jgi:alcohol dehydrogenase class IV